MSASSETVSLTLPGGARWAAVAELVLAGLGTRLDLPYDRIDELQLAVASILRDAPDGDVRMNAHAAPDVLEVHVGPISAEVAADPARRRVLDVLADAVAVRPGDDGARIVLTFARGRTG